MATPVTPVSSAAPAPSSAPVSAPASAPAPVTSPAPSTPATPSSSPAVTTTETSTPGGAAAPTPVIEFPKTPGAVSAPSKYDPKTAAEPPNSSDFPNTQQGIYDFVKADTEWSLAHPEASQRQREADIAAKNTGVLQPATTQAEDAVATEVKAAEGEQAKPQEAAATPTAQAATPAKIDEWATKSPELKAVFEKYPELHTEMMETARSLEAAKPVLDIVGTREEAQFAVQTAERLVSLETSWMLAADDPAKQDAAWQQTLDIFKSRDANGAEIRGADGKPVFEPDFQPFLQKSVSHAMEAKASGYDAEIATLQARLAGIYPNDDARADDADSLQRAQYAKAAYEFLKEDLAQGNDGAAALPKLPPDATPQQIAFQKQLEERQREIDAQSGRQTAESRRAANAALDQTINIEYGRGVNSMIEAHIAAMEQRGEYLPEYVLTDKYLNPQTGQPTSVTKFGADIYQKLEAKIALNPMLRAKLASLQALGAAGKEARLAEIKRIQNLYLPQIIQAEVDRIQNGIRASQQRRTANQPNPANGVARVEPLSQGTVMPGAMDQNQTRAWAEAEVRKNPNYASMTPAQRESLTMELDFKKQFAG